MSRKGKIKDTDLGLGREEANVRRLARGRGARVEVGLFDGQIATYGAFNEFGTATIPARPFLRGAFDANQQAYAEQLAEGAARILGGQSDVTAELTRLGIRAQSDVKRQIVELRDPPNAPTTVAQKGSSNPLVDTGAMLGAVVFEVRTGSQARGGE